MIFLRDCKGDYELQNFLPDLFEVKICDRKSVPKLFMTRDKNLEGFKHKHKWPRT